MMLGRLMMLLILAVPLMVGAADLKTKSGKVYRDYEITGATSAGIVIFHESGSATVEPADWPDAMKNEIAGYMAKHRQLAEAAAAKESKAAEDRVLNQHEALIIGRVLSVTPGGVLVSGSRPRALTNDTLGVTEKTRLLLDGADEKARSLYSKIYQEEAKRIGTYDKNGKMWAQSSTLERFAKALEKQNALRDVCFIEMNTSGITDNSEIFGRYYPVGVYSYVTVSGANSNVQRYTADRKTALEYLKDK